MTQKIIESQLKKMPVIRPGDAVRVHQKIKEGGKERIQVFEGVVIAAKHGKGISGTVTVRKVVDGVGVERIFPLHTPSLSKIEVISSAKVRRAKLYYLRDIGSKKAKLKKKEFAAAIAPEESKTDIVEETPTASTESSGESKVENAQ